MFIYAIQSIKAVGGPQLVSSLEQLVEHFKKNIGEWRRLSQADLTPLVEEEPPHLYAQMHQIHEEMISKIEAVAQDLKCLEAEEYDIAEAIEVAQQKMVFTYEEIGKARQMIVKAQAVLARDKPTHAAETAKLPLLTARSIHLQEQKREKVKELEEAQDHLAETVSPKRS